MKNWARKLLGVVRRLGAWSAKWVGLLTGRARRDLASRRVYWDDSVLLSLSNLVRETETRASGRVQVVSLAEFRAAIGDLWEKYQSRILMIAESTIARMIGKGNTFIPQSEDTWLLLLPGLSEDAAQDRADAIAANIGEKLVGAQFTPQELPLPSTSKLDLAGAFKADGSLDVEAVKHAIEKVRQTQALSIGDRAGFSRPPDPTARPIVARTRQISKAGQIKILLRPAWCAETQSIDSFFVRAFSEAGINVYGDAASHYNDATIVDLTKAAAGIFSATCGGRLQAKIAVPLPFATLQGSALPEIKRMVAALPQRDRLMRLRIEVVRIPAEASVESLVAVREIFRPYVREVAFMTNLTAPLDQLLVLDHVMLGTELTAESEARDEDIFQHMLMFRQRAGRRVTYMLGLNSRTHVRHAISAGLDEVGGPALLDDVKRLPQEIAIIHREDMLAP